MKRWMKLKRVAKRATHGLARTRATSAHGSGDIIVAFSTANRVPHYSNELIRTETKLNEAEISPFFQAVAEATEEAILNAILKAETVIGRDDHIREAILLDQIVLTTDRA